MDFECSRFVFFGISETSIFDLVNKGLYRLQDVPGFIGLSVVIRKAGTHWSTKDFCLRSISYLIRMFIVHYSLPVDLKRLLLTSFTLQPAAEDHRDVQ